MKGTIANMEKRRKSQPQIWEKREGKHSIKRSLKCNLQKYIRRSQYMVYGRIYTLDHRSDVIRICIYRIISVHIQVARIR